MVNLLSGDTYSHWQADPGMQRSGPFALVQNNSGETTNTWQWRALEMVTRMAKDVSLRFLDKD